jgi:hypothetical protein
MRSFSPATGINKPISADLKRKNALAPGLNIHIGFS